MGKSGPSSKVTPAVRARIKELAALGWGSTRIAKDLGGIITRQSIDEFLANRRPRLAAVASQATEPPSAPLQIADAAERLFVAATEGGLVDVERRLGRCRELADSLEPMVKDGNCNAATYTQLVKLESDLAERVEGLRPRPPVDPALDPVNVEATKRLTDWIEGMVARFEKSGRWVPTENGT